MHKAVALTGPQAACLDALRAGLDKKVLVALRAGLSLYQADQALDGLVRSRLAAIDDRHRWTLTARGRTAEFQIAPQIRTRGRKPAKVPAPGTAGARLLQLLDRPRHGTELPALLGVSRQHVHQLIATLSALELIRSGDAANPSFVLARRQDSALLLPHDQERVLSAFPDAEATTLARVASVSHMRARPATAAAAALCAAGLIEKVGSAAHDDLHRLTPLGAAHWQRSATGRRADAPPVPLRSDRVRAVLSHLQQHGAVRIRDLGCALGVPQPIMNGLMQRLKSRDLIRIRDWAQSHRPLYELTPGGREMLAGMQSRVDRSARRAPGESAPPAGMSAQGR